MKVTPRDYQEEAVNCLFKFFTENKQGHPVVAMPTGTGKSVVIARFLERAFGMYARQKVLVGTHVKELIAQNYAEFKGMWPNAPAGIYSAGLKRKDVYSNIIFCGIASIIKNIEQFGRVDLFLVDECHLISPEEESMYRRAIAIMQQLNPNVRVIGFTATPWRAGQGKITEGGVFTHIPFDVTSMKAFNRFISEGYLVPLIPRQTDTILDVSGVHLRGGEFIEKELQEAVNKDSITASALKETIMHGYDRNHWLVFGSGIAHVIRITEMLNERGISARYVHSKMPDKERDLNLKEWKEGKFRAIVNNGILTTGFNFKPLDLIVMLRPTHSTILWVQMLGRGTRPSPDTGKKNCLVLDFAGNTRRLGPINDPVIPRKKGEKTGEVPIKICDKCGMYNHISARFCGGEAIKTDAGCGAPFAFKTLINNGASTEALIKTEELPITETFNVETVTYDYYQTKSGKPPCIRVTYRTKFKKFTEYVLFEHVGFGERKARSWWKERTDFPFPENSRHAVQFLDLLKAPKQIRVIVNMKYPEIVQCLFDSADAENQFATSANFANINTVV